LSSLISGNTSLDEFHDWVARQVLGSRDIQQAPEPIHVMDMIRRTDRLVNNRIFDGENRNLLEDCYVRLCEFAHPNFHSYSLALRVDRENGLMLIRYDEQTVREEEFDLIGYLDISNRIFVDIFDRFAACVERIGA